MMDLGRTVLQTCCLSLRGPCLAPSPLIYLPRARGAGRALGYAASAAFHAVIASPSLVSAATERTRCGYHGSPRSAARSCSREYAQARPAPLGPRPSARRSRYCAVFRPRASGRATHGRSVSRYPSASVPPSSPANSSKRFTRSRNPLGGWFGKPLTARKLASLLRPYGVEPRKERDWRGYYLGDFLDAWSRYLAEPATPATPATDEVV